jgi:hypothetical protein
MFLCTHPSALATSLVIASIATSGSRRWLIETKTNPASLNAFGLSATSPLWPACHPPPWIQNTTGRFRAFTGA